MVKPGNALNITSSGVVTFNAPASFSGSAITQNDVLIGGASNAISSLAATDNGVLISSTSGVPEWLANGTTGQVLLATTSSTPSWGTAPLASNSGTVVSEHRTSGTGVITITTAAATTATTLTTSNMTSIGSVTFSPAATTHVLKFAFSSPYSNTNAGSTAWAIFQGSTLLAAFGGVSAGSSTNTNTINLLYYIAAGTTSSTTYSIYGTQITGSAADLYVNGTNSGAALYGGSAWSFIVTEVLP